MDFCNAACGQIFPYATIARTIETGHGRCGLQFPDYDREAWA